MFHHTKLTNKACISAKILKSLRDNRYSEHLHEIANYKKNIYFIDDFHMELKNI